jgi:hypothetical protein
MNASTTIPVSITLEAAARLTELGLQADMGRMIEYTRQTVPGLQRVEVILEPPYDTGDCPYLTIRAFRPLTHRWDERVEQAWGRWKVSTFPPPTCQHITFTLVEGGAGAEGSTLPPLDSLGVPVVLKPGASERIDELGMQAEFWQVLEHTCGTVPGLARIEVEVAERYDTGGEPGITIEAVTEHPLVGDDSLDRSLGQWWAETFPPEVREHIAVFLRSEEDHAG